VFHRNHSHDEPERAAAPVEPARTVGVILDWGPSALYRTKKRLLVGVKFDDGQKVEFNEEITDIVLPQEGDFAARIHAFTQEPIPVPISVGDKIPVCYDPADRTRMWIDVAAVNEAATRRHMEQVQARRARADALLDASEPVHPEVRDEPGH
jgi:hypothetical protein